MNSYSLTHLSDPVLLRDLVAIVARERVTTADLLAHIAEVDARRLYLPAAYPSMYEYCVRELRLSEQAALKRLRAARTARRFPAIFTALAEGRLHLAAVVLLAPYLTEETADELLTAATHKTKSEIEQLLAERFPRPEVLSRVEAIAPSLTLAAEQLSPGTVGTEPLVRGTVEHPARGVETRSKVTPLAPQRFALQLTIGQSTYDKLQHAQALLSHRVCAGDLAEVLDRALDALVHQLEKRKFAATARPRRHARRSSADPRYIPADVKRAVRERDGDQCTFVSDVGRRCPARSLLQFDHIDPVARGGRATVAGMRLRCRAHNQYEGERMFGTAFMSHKREEARRATAEARARATAAAAEQAPERDVIPWLRRLGFRADEARRAAALCERIPDAPLEERVRVALSHLSPGAATHGRRRAAGSLGTAA